jgi:hypothetical protein
MARTRPTMGPIPTTRHVWSAEELDEEDGGHVGAVQRWLGSATTAFSPGAVRGDAAPRKEQRDDPQRPCRDAQASCRGTASAVAVRKMRTPASPPDRLMVLHGHVPTPLGLPTNLGIAARGRIRQMTALLATRVVSDSFPHTDTAVSPWDVQPPTRVRVV